MALSKGFVQNSGVTPLDARMMDGARLTKNADGSVRTGVLWSSAAGGNVVSSQATMSVVVASADFVLSRGASDGAIVLSNRGTQSVTIPAAPGANSQYHLVYVKQNDGGSGGQGDSDSLANFYVLSGTAAASPTVPATPTGAVALATVLVPAGVTATNASGVVITNVFQNTAMYGSPIVFPSLSAMRSASAASETLGRVSGNASALYRFDGTDWRPVATVQVASLVATSIALASSTTPSLLPLGSPVSTDATLLATTSSGVQVKFAGQYRVTATINWATSSTGVRTVEVVADGASLNPSAADSRPASGATTATLTSVVPLTAGQLVRVQGAQSSGGSLNFSCRLVVELVALT